MLYAVRERDDARDPERLVTREVLTDEEWPITPLLGIAVVGQRKGPIGHTLEATPQVIPADVKSQPCWKHREGKCAEGTSTPPGW